MARKTLAVTAVLLAALAGLLPAADVKVVIQEWSVPEAKSRPHDPAIAPDGALWYTGQMNNTLGRLDPKTGQIQQWRLKTPQSGPHGLVADTEGNIWYTGNSKAHIGKLNPKSGELVEYPMPDPKARDPHTPIFDKKGTLWFTVQAGNFVGKLDPKSGLVTLKESPTPNSRPYGIVIDSTGTPWYCEFNSNKLARINPDTMEIREYILPEGARPRRLTVGLDDTIYYSDHARGFVGHLNPITGAVQEWASPAGPQSRPYGIAATKDGVIWYSESGVQPNTIVRFDPKSKSFSKWDIPSGGGVIRHMVASADGTKLYIACSGVDKVGIVEISN